MNKMFKPTFNKLNTISVSFWCLDIGKSPMNFMITTKKTKHRTHCHKGKEVKKMFARNHLHSDTWVERHCESKMPCPRTQHDVPGQGPVSRRSRNAMAPGTHSKISNLMIAELFYSNILNMNRGSLHSSSRGIHSSICKWLTLRQ